jgi:hypothetical protein
LAKVPEQLNSTSSGWAPKARISSFISVRNEKPRPRPGFYIKKKLNPSSCTHL